MEIQILLLFQLRKIIEDLCLALGHVLCYDESKRYGETLSVNYSAVYDLPVTIARPFNNYGPGLNIADGRVIPDFASNILKMKTLFCLVMALRRARFVT